MNGVSHCMNGVPHCMNGVPHYERRVALYERCAVLYERCPALYERCAALYERCAALYSFLQWKIIVGRKGEDLAASDTSDIYWNDANRYLMTGKFRLDIGPMFRIRNNSMAAMRKCYLVL